MQNLKGGWKFSFPEMFDSYRDLFLIVIWNKFCKLPCNLNLITLNLLSSEILWINSVALTDKLKKNLNVDINFNLSKGSSLCTRSNHSRVRTRHRIFPWTESTWQGLLRQNQLAEHRQWSVWTSLIILLWPYMEKCAYHYEIDSIC